MNHFRIPYEGDPIGHTIELDQLRGRIQHLEEQLATTEYDRDRWAGLAKRLRTRMNAARRALNEQ